MTVVPGISHRDHCAPDLTDDVARSRVGTRAGTGPDGRKRRGPLAKAGSFPDADLAGTRSGRVKGRPRKTLERRHTDWLAGRMPSVALVEDYERDTENSPIGRWMAVRNSRSRRGNKRQDR